ncbi:unnamed protein product [Gordionus sp. m RMFG-2023]
MPKPEDAHKKINPDLKSKTNERTQTKNPLSNEQTQNTGALDIQKCWWYSRGDSYSLIKDRARRLVNNPFKNCNPEGSHCRYWSDCCPACRCRRRKCDCNYIPRDNDEDKELIEAEYDSGFQMDDV